MLWYAELLIEAALFLRLVMRKDGRQRFEALIGVDLMTQAYQILGERMHLFGFATKIWYIGVLIQIPLIGLALTEAADYRPLWHRRLLFWWIAATFGCAWIRIFPYTGTVLLAINSLAFAAWILMSGLEKEKSMKTFLVWFFHVIANPEIIVNDGE